MGVTVGEIIERLQSYDKNVTIEELLEKQEASSFIPLDVSLQTWGR